MHACMYAYMYLPKGHVPHTHTHTHALTHQPTHTACCACIYWHLCPSICWHIVTSMYMYVQWALIFWPGCGMTPVPSSTSLYNSPAWHDPFTCVTWHIPMCDTTHSYVCHDSFIRETWLIHRPSPCSPLRLCTTALRDMTHSCSYA